MNDPDNIAERLATWRADNQLSRIQAAAFFSVPIRTYSEAETGAHLPRGFGKTYLLRVLAEHEALKPAPKPKTKPKKQKPCS